MRLIFKNELKNAFKKRFIISIIFFAVVLQVFLHFGKSKYYDNIASQDSLKKAENERVSHYLIYRQYATDGIMLMFVPSDLSILFNHSNFELLLSNVNFTYKVNIFSPMKGKKFFSGDSYFLNFMGLSLLFVFYFSIVYGKNLTFNSDYLKFLSNFSSKRKAFWFTSIFRLFLINIAFIIVFVINISVLLFYNINLFRLTLLPFFWGLLLVTTLSFSMGCILGSIRNNFKRNTAFFFIYIISTILLPLSLNYYTQRKANDIKPVFEYDRDNLIIVMIEEEMMIKKHGVLKPGEKPTEEMIRDARQVIFNDFKKINENENQLKHIMMVKIKDNKFISSLFPTLFYFSISEDASTNSHDRFIDFYTYSQKRKQEFVLFCVDKIYPLPDTEKKEKPAVGKQSTENNQDSQADQAVKPGQGAQTKPPTQTTQPVLPKIENFIKDNEDLFFAQSKLPRNFWLGSIISILWIAGFLFAAYRRTLKQIKAEPGKVRDCEVEMKSNEFNYLLTADPGLKNQVYNHLSGDGISNIKMTLDGEVLEKIDFIYVYEIKQFLNDVDQGCLYKELLDEEMPGGVKPWKSIIQYAADNKKALLLDDFFNGMDLDDIDDFIAAVKKREIIALYVGGEFFQACHLDVDLLFCPMDLSIPGLTEKLRAIRKSREKNQ
jgi:hypothetical protein